MNKSVKEQMNSEFNKKDSLYNINRNLFNISIEKVARIDSI